MSHIQQRLNRNALSTTWDIMSLNNVHEPRNAEFTAFLGSFYVEGQSNDNNFILHY